MNIINICIINDIADDKTKIGLHQSEWLNLEREKMHFENGHLPIRPYRYNHYCFSK